tara:strand:- start:592 stop:1269 length:678 start_codon:yes stop_codon:yes gene_type:complete
MNNDLSNYWKTYNQEKKSLLKKIVEFNNKNKFNFVEYENYNHIRDILSLILATINIKAGKCNILDYGSNLLTISNLNNKIDTTKFKFFIFDPFLSKKNKNQNLKKINYKISNEKKMIFKKNYTLINFGSSIQYQQDFFENFEKLNLSKTKFIIFTSTPFSLSKTYISKQSNQKYLFQKVYSYNRLVSKLKSKNFKLIFKSRNNDKYIACKKKIHKTFSLNLVFRK